MILLVLPGCATLAGNSHSAPYRERNAEPAGRASAIGNDTLKTEVPPAKPHALVGYSIDSEIITSGVSVTELQADRVQLLSDHRELFSEGDSVSGFACTDVDDELSCWNRIVEDHRNFYSCPNLGFLSLGFGLGAIAANTHIDMDISHHTHASIRGAQSDEWGETFHSPKGFGNGYYTLPIVAAAWGIGSIFDETAAGRFSSEWGERSLRALLVGVPPLILLQRATGGSRPEEGPSDWDFWDDNNGVSGHSFMGAIPFFTAAQMVDDPVLKSALYAGSLAVPISRITDGDHYPSQAFLGWWMAWSASMAIDATQDRDSHWRTVPLLEPGCSGLNFEFRW